MDITGSGVDFYYWVNLWYSSLDLIKLYLEEIQEEFQKSMTPGISLHPKLKFKSSIKNIKYHLEECKNEPKEKVNNELIELQQNNSLSANPSENINIKNKKNHIIKDNDIYFKHNFKPFEGEIIESVTIENPQMESLNHIIGKLNHNTDLNLIVDEIKKLKTSGNTFFKDNLNIFLYSHELDKFDNMKKMRKNFCVQINFSMQEKR